MLGFSIFILLNFAPVIPVKCLYTARRNCISIWALFGLWDYYRVTHHSIAKQLFDAGVNAVKEHIDCYDTGYWVLYEQKPLSLVSGTYMDLQIDQMEVLYALTQYDVFDIYAKKWYAYSVKKMNFPKIVIQKIRSVIMNEMVL